MNPGDVVLLSLVDASGSGAKLRPTVLLANLPGPYQTLLVCGISTRPQAIRPQWDEPIQPGDADFPSSGLHQASVIRLSFLRAATRGEIRGAIGTIDAARLLRLLTRLADHLRP